MHHGCPKFPKTLENDQNAPKTTTMPTETFKMTKIPLNPKKKRNTLETTENDQCTARLSQNILYSLDFWGILVGFFFLILEHFTHFSNVKLYILKILYLWGILVIYEASSFDCSFYPFQDYFGLF